MVKGCGRSKADPTQGLLAVLMTFALNGKAFTELCLGVDVLKIMVTDLMIYV